MFLDTLTRMKEKDPGPPPNVFPQTHIHTYTTSRMSSDMSEKEKHYEEKSKRKPERDWKDGLICKVLA
ncbi:hypothetical protein STEG23_022575 [Scotinomys teguina]